MPFIGILESLQKTVRQYLVSKKVRHYRTSLFQTYLVLAIALFLVLAILSRNVSYFGIDLEITNAFQRFDPEWFRFLMTDVSSIGRQPQMILLITLISLFIWSLGLKLEALFALFASGGSAVIAASLKLLVQRPRPGGELVLVLERLDDFSFPSGHVIAYVAFFGFIFFLCYTLIHHSKMRTVLLGILGSLIVLVGPSRIYLGEHWASDVLGGYLLGSIWLVVTVHFYHRLRHLLSRQ